MMDYHCHLEKGEPSKEWADRFLQVWHRRGITEFGFSEHAYLFQELAPLYQGRGDFSDTPLGRRQRQWFEAVMITLGWIQGAVFTNGQITLAAL